jgi:hypothetical protein
MEEKISVQPVGMMPTTGWGAASSICRTAKASPQPAQARWPLEKSSGF